MQFDTEVLIVGGGPAGLGAAMALARLSRKAIVCDDDRPRNGPAESMHNFPGHEGVSPREWRRKAKEDVQKYPTIDFVAATVTSAVKLDNGFLAKLSNGKEIKAKRLVLAYGMRDELPEIPGFKELWGKSVFHCPFCHGYEFKDKKYACVGNGPAIMHMLPLITALTADIVLFTNGEAKISPEERATINKRGIRIVEEAITHLKWQGEQVQSVCTSKEVIPRDAVLLIMKMPMELTSSLGTSLGCERNEMGGYKILNEFQSTTVPGVYAAGDIASPKSVLFACALGQMAGVGAGKDLLTETFMAQ
jgi:thioredoxin reductase